MTAQIIFPKQDTYWILTDGVSYFDGFTAANCVTTVGSSTQIYWIGTNHEEYVQACLDIGLTPRNTGPSIVIAINPETPALILEQKIKDLQEKLDNIPDPVNTSSLEDINTRIDSLDPVVSGVRISARQARLWLIQNGVDLNMINSVIDSIEDPILRESIKVEWEYAPYIERSYQWINSLASQLGLSESDLDRAFAEGSSI